MNNIRNEAIRAAWSHREKEIEIPDVHAPVFFNENVFTRLKMREYIPHATLSLFFDAIDNGKPISSDVADSIASGMKRWAMEKGAIHFTHWFQPMNGKTAEKHITFTELDEHGEILENFTGEVLFQQQPQSQEFPYINTRNTFEARGNTIWDPSSPAFILGDLLCIPSIFVTYSGDALDYKSPLLRSIRALNQASTNVCNYFDRNVKHVSIYLGWEQEFFLVDEDLYALRNDLQMTGRTLHGHVSAKNQQLNDQDLSTIPQRVLAFITEVEVEAYKLGIPIKTRHNEAAPNQYEIASSHEEVNISNDHNLVLMSLMERIAKQHHFKVLFHDKPFNKINGSSKHCNWSLMTNNGTNLLSPGRTPYANLSFVTFLSIILMAIHNHRDLLKASIVTTNNSHRLCKSTAPPANISIFLGDRLSTALKLIEKAPVNKGIIVNAKKEMKLGVGLLPETFVDNTDCQRISPIAFTGNRIEFRSVGASINCGVTMCVVNSIVASQMIEFSNEVEELISKGKLKEQAIFTVIKRYLNESHDIHYDGIPYSEEWKTECAKRNLDYSLNVPLVIDNFITESSVKMFSQVGVLSQKELIARSNVRWYYYSMKRQIESSVLSSIAITNIIPAAKNYQNSLLENVLKIKSIFPPEKAEQMCEGDFFLINRIGDNIQKLIREISAMQLLKKEADKLENRRDQAIAYHDNVIPLMLSIRESLDELELFIDDAEWPLPKYSEMLFIN